MKRVVSMLYGLLINPHGDLPESSLSLKSELSAKVIRANGKVEDRGVVCRRLVTTAFVNFLVDCLQSSGSQIYNFKYHDCGTGVVAENTSDTALGTPFGGSRVVGTQEEGASTNIYKSIATIPFTGAFAITEHGLFSAAAAGTLMDRSVFAAINVGNGDSIQFTYQLTCNAGG
jgi:hypothetical protein